MSIPIPCVFYFYTLILYDVIISLSCFDPQSSLCTDFTLMFQSRFNHKCPVVLRSENLPGQRNNIHVNLFGDDVGIQRTQ